MPKLGFMLVDSCRCGRDLDIGVGVAPQEWEPRQPVFCVDQPADASELFGWHYANRCREFRAGNFPADGAGCDLDLRVVADALALSQFTIGHEVESVVALGNPDRRVHCDATFPEGGEADVMLAADFGGDGSHADIVKCREEFCGGAHRDPVNFRVPSLTGFALGRIQ